MRKACAKIPGRSTVSALWLALSVVSLPACGTSDGDAASREALSRDLSLAGESTTTQPQIVFGDTAATESPRIELNAPPDASPDAAPNTTQNPQRAPASTPRSASPVREAPAPAPVSAPDAAPVPAPLPAPDSGPKTESTPARRTLLASGTALVGTTGTRVCNTSNRPGDRVVMRLTSDVAGADGAVIAAGTPVLLEFASADDSTLVFRVKSISLGGELHPISASASVESELEGVRVSGGNDNKKVIGGAILGAIIGSMIGKDAKGAVVGAAGGAAAGTVAARRGGTSENCLPAGGTVRVVLSDALTISGAQL